MTSGRNLMHEADIGSGEKSPGEHETQKMIEQVGKDRRHEPDAVPEDGHDEVHKEKQAVDDDRSNPQSTIEQHRRGNRTRPADQHGDNGGLIVDNANQVPPKGN